MDILVVDDEKAVRESTRIALEMDDHYVEAVSNGTVALSASASSSPTMTPRNVVEKLSRAKGGLTPLLHQ